VTVFHIHRGGPEEVGPVVLDLETATGIGSITTGFDAATNSYSLLINKTYTDTGTAVSITDLINGFKAGNPYYFNVHTTNFPGGEVRGNLAIPEPGTLALVAGASLPLLGLARRGAGGASPKRKRGLPAATRGTFRARPFPRRPGLLPRFGGLWYTSRDPEPIGSPVTGDGPERPGRDHTGAPRERRDEQRQ
jgi:hypothetical protein